MRFSRQILVDEIGYDGQVQLLSRNVEIYAPDPWRDLMGRYLIACGLAVRIVCGDPKDSVKIVCVETGSVYSRQWNAEVSIGQGMQKLGLWMTQVVLDLARDR